MRKILISLSALALSAGMASAGGKLAVPVEPVVAAPAPAPVMAYDWAGGYAGLGLTYGRTSYRSGLSDDVFDLIDDEFDLETTGRFFWPSGSGFGLGGFAGFNWQNGDFVYGVEGHLSAHRMRGTRRVADEDEDISARIRTDVRSLASLRGRVGVAQDRTLFFVTGGPAIGNVRHSARLVDGDDVATFSQSRSVGGFVIGAGIEHALANGWHVRGDLEHYRFGKRNFNTLGVSDPEADFPNVRTRVNLARVSAVFRF